MGTVSPVSQTDMKFLSFLLCVSLTAAAIVRREAEPGGYGAEPQCTVTPVKECKQRTVETPKKVCQTVVDKHEDTVVTETCEEEIPPPASKSPPPSTTAPRSWTGALPWSRPGSPVRSRPSRCNTLETLSANTRAPQPPLATCPSLHLSWSTMCPHLWSKQHPPRPLPLSALQPQ